MDEHRGYPQNCLFHLVAPPDMLDYARTLGEGDIPYICKVDVFPPSIRPDNYLCYIDPRHDPDAAWLAIHIALDEYVADMRWDVVLDEITPEGE